MSLLAVGTIAFDSIETPTDSRIRIMGGSATYFSYAAAFFAPVSLVGIVGKDWPDSYSRLLEERGIDLAGVVRDLSQDSYFWHGRYTINFQDRETLECQLRGFDKWVPIVPEQFLRSRFVFLGAASPTVQLQTLAQCNLPEFVFADTVDMWIETAGDDLRCVLARVNCLLINDSEARQLTSEQDLVRAGRKIQAMGPTMVVIKKGEHGSLFFHEGSIFPCPAFPTDRIVDPTGAGDSFAGAMIGYLTCQPKLDRRALLNAIHYGTVVASFTVGGFSIEGLEAIEMSDIEERRTEFRNMLGVD